MNVVATLKINAESTYTKRVTCGDGNPKGTSQPYMLPQHVPSKPQTKGLQKQENQPAPDGQIGIPNGSAGHGGTGLGFSAHTVTPDIEGHAPPGIRARANQRPDKPDRPSFESHPQRDPDHKFGKSKTRRNVLVTK